MTIDVPDRRALVWRPGDSIASDEPWRGGDLRHKLKQLSLSGRYVLEGDVDDYCVHAAAFRSEDGTASLLCSPSLVSSSAAFARATMTNAASAHSEAAWPPRCRDPVRRRRSWRQTRLLWDHVWCQRERERSRTVVEQRVKLALAGVATGDTIFFMPGRRPSLVIRILRTVLILFGPLVLSFAVVMSFPSLPEAIGKMMLLVSWAWLYSALILTPELLFSGEDSSSGPSDADGGGGTNLGPPSPPSAPRGGIPLTDAEQARERVRDHDRPDRVGPRRRAREPERAPAQTLPDA